VDSSDPSGARSRFVAALSSLESGQSALAQLANACVGTLPFDRAAIAVHGKGTGLEALCASDHVAEHVEWVQNTLGEGPGVDAVAAGGPMTVVDLADPDGPWPTFTAEAVEFGVRAMYAVPLQLGAIRVGVLDLYRAGAGELAPTDFADALAVSDVVTAVLLAAGDDGGLGESLDPWWDQPFSTKEIHQATGMLVFQLDVSARDAYVRLQAFAYAHHRLLDDVAHAVVDRRLRLDQDPDANPTEVALRN
jgi:hypothetical protein